MKGHQDLRTTNRKWKVSEIIHGSCGIFCVSPDQVMDHWKGHRRNPLMRMVRVVMVGAIRHFQENVSYPDAARILGLASHCSVHKSYVAFLKLPEEVRDDMLIRVEAKMQSLT